MLWTKRQRKLKQVTNRSRKTNKTKNKTKYITVKRTIKSIIKKRAYALFLLRDLILFLIFHGLFVSLEYDMEWLTL